MTELSVAQARKRKEGAFDCDLRPSECDEKIKNARVFAPSFLSASRMTAEARKAASKGSQPSRTLRGPGHPKLQLQKLGPLLRGLAAVRMFRFFPVLFRRGPLGLRFCRTRRFVWGILLVRVGCVRVMRVGIVGSGIVRCGVVRFIASLGGFDATAFELAGFGSCRDGRVTVVLGGQQ